MAVDAETEVFIRKAEEINARLATNALIGVERVLDLKSWAKPGRTTAEFYVRYHNQLERSLAILLVEHAGELPAVIRFLASTDLERAFPLVDMSDGFGPISATIHYVIAKAVTCVLSGRVPPVELATLAAGSFAALWALPGASDMESRPTYAAYETLLQLTFGDHEKIVRIHEAEDESNLAKFEGAIRTLEKQCYVLSRIADGKADDDLRFAARSFSALLKFHHYLWRVNEDLDSDIALVPLVLISWLHDRITRGTAPSAHELFASMTPRAVLTEVHAIREA